MSKRNKKGNSYLFDSFSGFKKDDGLHKKDVFYYDEIEEVKRNIKKLSALDERKGKRLILFKLRKNSI